MCLHVFYEDVGFEIADTLASVETNYTLFVTYIDRIDPGLARRLGALNREIYFIPTLNRGRDILPFLRCLSHPRIRQLDYVVKLHTKRGGSQIGDIWRHVCLDSVVGNALRFDSTLQQFMTNRSLAMAGPAMTYISATKFMYGNDSNVKRIIDSLLDGYRPVEWGFFAGTMFWARREIFDPLLKFEEAGMQFTAERGSADGELEHAFERCFGLLPSRLGGKIGLLRENVMEVLVGVGSPSKVAISKTMAEAAKSALLTSS